MFLPEAPLALCHHSVASCIVQHVKLDMTEKKTTLSRKEEGKRQIYLSFHAILPPAVSLQIH